MKVIIFLGNPGKKYKRNRHNAGFIFGEKFAREHSVKIKKKDFQSLCGTGEINGAECLLMFPQTYMNASGRAAEALKFYNETAGRMIVVHDEIELPFGVIKHKFSGGHKGHNGLRSIMQTTGTPDFHRIRIGVSRPGEAASVADYLLSDFSREELVTLDNLYPEICETLFSAF